MGDFGEDIWMPVPLGWWAMVSRSWPAAWKGPVFDVLCHMWREGMRVPDDDRRLAQAAGVPLKTWKTIRAGVGAFFTVEPAIVTQTTLAAKYEKAMSKREKFSERGRNNVNKRWEKARQPGGVAWRHPDSTGITNGKANGHTNGNTNGTTNGITKPVPLVGDRAFRERSFLDLQREEGRSNASPVPILPSDPQVVAVLESFPKRRVFAGGRLGVVRLGPNPERAIADFLTANPEYPLHWVVKWWAKANDTPMDLPNFLASPPHPSQWEAAWRKDEAYRLRPVVQDILLDAAAARAKEPLDVR